MKHLRLVTIAALFLLVGCSRPAATPIHTFSLAPTKPTALEADSTPVPSQMPTVVPSTTVSTDTPTPPSTSTPAQTVEPDVAPEAAAYLTAAIDIMQAHSVNRYRIDWPTLRMEAFENARGAVKPADTYAAIKSAVEALGDHHSAFLPPGRSAELGRKTIDDFPLPKGELVAGRLGYISIAGFGGLDEWQVNQYATRVQQVVREVDAKQPCGWIVDLRPNTGGNMWPMLAGIGPVLGEGQVGAFVDPDGQETLWYYKNGQALWEDVVLAQVEGPVYELKRPFPPVAVLTGRQTSSSGEAIVIAFRQRPDTRSFGEPTSGLSTGNLGFPLSDGATLYLTVSTFADRSGEVYGGPVIPDEIVVGPDSEDAIPQEAIDWLMSQPACMDEEELAAAYPPAVQLTMASIFS
jgi:hypothetical protein